MIRTKEELIESINALLPEDAEDLSLLEDFSDTYDSMTVKPDPYEDKYNDLLKKYRERFTDVTVDTVIEEPEKEVVEEEKVNFSDLFETKE